MPTVKKSKKAAYVHPAQRRAKIAPAPQPAPEVKPSPYESTIAGVLDLTTAAAGIGARLAAALEQAAADYQEDVNTAHDTAKADYAALFGA